MFVSRLTPATTSTMSDVRGRALTAAAGAILAVGAIPSAAMAAEAELFEVETAEEGAPTVMMSIPLETVDPIDFDLQATVAFGKRELTVATSCSLEDGVLSESLDCGSMGELALEDIATSVDEVELTLAFSPVIPEVVAGNALTIKTLDVSEDSEYHSAEAGWKSSLLFFGWWECQLEDSDHEWCAAECGLVGVKSLSTSPQIRSNNPHLEPSCEVTCECNDGTEIEVLDPPQVLAW